jgi:trk system potassium uptake protein TrkA
MDANVLHDAGIEDSDAVVVATNGDNTNLVLAQVARQRFEVPMVVARILDPARAEFYRGQGMKIICPTQTAIDDLTATVRTFAETAQALEARR